VPAKLSEAWAAFAANVAMTFTVTTTCPTKTNLFKKFLYGIQAIGRKFGSSSST
jgi:hypothetical protein